jgi:predicted nucleotidyltransferase
MEARMLRDDVLEKIASQRESLDRFHIKTLAVFGSVARGEARADSDADLLVEFSVPVGLFEFVRLRRFLEEILGARVDLVTPGALKPLLRQAVLREAVRAA